MIQLRVFKIFLKLHFSESSHLYPAMPAAVCPEYRAEDNAVLCHWSIEIVIT